MHVIIRFPIALNGWTLFFLAMSTFFVSCRKKEKTEYRVKYVDLFQKPTNFPEPPADPNTDPHNALTSAGVELGRKLFYDKRLSRTHTVSCASCHVQQQSFTETVALSRSGVSGNQLLRHTPVLVNLAWTTNGLFWDGGSSGLENQAYAPLAHPDEMFKDLYVLQEELSGDTEYVRLFREAFNDEVHDRNVVKALAQFQKMLVSADSRYDQYVRGEYNTRLTPIELSGLRIFEIHCRRCHATDLFTDNSFHNNGLDHDFNNADHEGVYQGRYRITGNIADMGKFKTPALRNIDVSAPYMHDGRFATLDDVLEHYSEGVEVSATTDPALGERGGLHLSANERAAIIAFLHTLTDHRFLHSQAFGPP